LIGGARPLPADPVTPGNRTQVFQAFEDQQNKLALFVGERLAGHPQIHIGAIATLTKHHFRVVADCAMIPRGGPNQFAHGTFAAVQTVTASLRDFPGVNAIQRFPAPFSDQRLFVFGQHFDCSGVAFHDAYILVHYKSGHGYGIEKHSMKSLVQKLNGNAIHGTHVYKSGTKSETKKGGAKAPPG
jgi:hypothetical protein